MVTTMAERETRKIEIFREWERTEKVKEGKGGFLTGINCVNSWNVAAESPSVSPCETRQGH